MAPSLIMTEEDRTRFVNRKLADEMTRILVTVARWGSNKNQNQTFEDYLKNERKMSNKVFKKYFYSPDDMSKISQTSFDELDVTFLIKILPHMCDGINEIVNWKNISDNNSLEFHLNQIKNSRNSVMHEAHRAALDKNLVNKVETTALNILDIAGVKYGKETDEINAAKNEAKKLISTIKNAVMTEEEKIQFYQKRLLYEGLPELRKKTADYQGSVSPYFEHVKNFCIPQLTYKENNAEKTISCEKIFNHAKEKGAQILVIKGQSGEGKSYLMKEIEADIFREKGKKIFQGSDEFNTPLLFECRKRTCETIADFASEEFPCLGATSSEKGLTEKVLSKMNGLLLVDGVDEANEVSNKMLDNIIAFLKKNRDLFCIFTSRPFSAEEFQKKLKLHGLSHFQTLALKKLTSREEQLKFINTSCEKGEDISSAYKRTNLKLQSPVLLAIYGYLWLKEPESLESCKSQEQIMREWIDCGLEVARQRLEQRDVMDYEDVANNILESISLVSFSCLLKNQFEIKANEIKWLKGKIKEFAGISVNMAPHEVLSCFFVGYSDSKNNLLLYSHKSQQEMLASLFVFKQIESGKNVKEILSEALEYDRPSQSPMPRARNYDFPTFFKK